MNITSRLTPIDKGYDQLATGLSLVKKRNIGGKEADLAQAYRYDLVTYPIQSLESRSQPSRLVFNGGTVNFQVFDRSNLHGSFRAQCACQTGKPMQDVTIEFDPFSELPPLMSAGLAHLYRNMTIWGRERIPL